ncbi:MAG: S46 family peptidase [Bacteroidales bacterium]|nr:S46 family peptidase [Bacteroidales bacterium]
MKKIALFLISVWFIFLQIYADEGLWMPNLLQKRQADMQSKGLQISVEDIYSETQPSLKDAVVRLSTGCTGGFVSKEGLVLTNHHCVYQQIQMHSTVEKDYLQYGFWAMNKEEELPCPGMSVSMVVKTLDVTEAVTAGTTAEMSEQDAAKIRNENIKTLIADAEKETGYKVEVRPFFGGNQFYLYLIEVFEDVRLVGVPPSNIGKFGGDTDNWTWPRHTGDFAFIRVYVDTNNKPAKYSKDNVPYRPCKHFKLSLKGPEENEFTFVFGYPGRTNLYLTSYALRLITEVENPIAIAARTKRLDIIKTAMEQDPKTRIQYTAKASRISNTWKRWQGENRGIKRINGVAQKEGYEENFQEWANTYNDGQYKDLLPQLKTAYAELEPLSTQNLIFNEHVLAPEIVGFVQQFNQLLKLSNDKTVKPAVFNEQLNLLKGRVTPFFKDFDASVDKQLFKSLSIVDIDGVEVRFVDFPDKNFDQYVDEMYAKSIFTNEAKLNAILKKFPSKSAIKSLENDPLLNYVDRVYSMYYSMIAPALREQNAIIDVLQRTYIKAQMDMQPDREFYPDANSTLRVAYGKVEGYSPSDAITYKYYTTLSGLMAKENPNVFEFVVEDKLKKLYNDKNFGPYANSKGEMPIAFVASNHTIGGNSGSPVLNGKGEIIGVNFDRAWEGTMSGLMFDSTQCRNISVDVRFILFMLDKYAGATHLLDEIEIAP